MKCTCHIEYYEGFKDKTDQIIFCPLHAQAPKLYEALSKIRAMTANTILYDIANQAIAPVEEK